VTEQLIGETWLNAPPFRYAGNVGPVPVAGDLCEALLRIGRALGEQCGLLGLFGVDFILHEGRPWVVEVNPRYPASVEVLELSTGVLTLSLHQMAFDPKVSARSRLAVGAPVVGKAVLYAPQRSVMPAYDPSHDFSHILGDEVRAFRHSIGVHFADIPPPGEAIEWGWPVLTVFAEADDRDRCVAILRERSRQVQGLIFGDQVQAAR
jgi:predicted ATP-grasp superfamily ATP-dependent carboligase